MIAVRRAHRCKLPLNETTARSARSGEIARVWRLPIRGENGLETLALLFAGANRQRRNLKAALANGGVFVAVSKIDILQDRTSVLQR